MFEINSKYGIVKVFAETIEEEAIRQIEKIANSQLGENADIRIMPDCHSGRGCVIGTTMLIADKVCPNIVGVDIGCGVSFYETDKLNINLQSLDDFIRENIPYGQNLHNNETLLENRHLIEDLRCINYLALDSKFKAYRSLGTLGGGNHFIEVYDKGIAVHSGSRNIGYKVANFYQNLAFNQMTKEAQEIRREMLFSIEPQKRTAFLKENNLTIDKELACLTGEGKDNYLHDMGLMQKFAMLNRNYILNSIIRFLNVDVIRKIESVHNYIDLTQKIIRKGAISAQLGELCVIPLNMRDGLLICKGRGNPDWNYSAPHGAGRLYSRSKAKDLFQVEDYKKSMNGIYSTCINENTLDEAPFVYKNYHEIINCIEPTVDILDRLVPIYNFKAN